jgi:hypothetical protein
LKKLPRIKLEFAWGKNTLNYKRKRPDTRPLISFCESMET